MAPSASGPLARLDHMAFNDDQTILYIEDNPTNLQLIDDVIDQISGLKLITSPSAETGVEIARAVIPDLIILDINMPGMDGFEALAALQKNEATRDIPVMALSADASKNTINRGLEAGFFEYLSKPLDLIKFLKVLNSVLGREIGDLGSGI